VSSWTITKNHCMMHGQQNVKKGITFYLYVENLPLQTIVSPRTYSILHNTDTLP